MTPLQQAAHAVIDRWDSPLWKDQPHTSVYIAELRKALGAEQAQAVEPVAWIEFTPDGSMWFLAYGKNSRAKQEPLYLHPAPPAAQHDLPLDLLERLSKTMTRLGYSTPEGGTEHFGAQIESQLYNLCRGVDSILAQQVATPYDQQALELCDKCGWKAIMPGEPCFVCNMQTEAQQVAVPDGWALVPVEPTPAMSAAGFCVAEADHDPAGVYRAMLAAAQGAKP